MGVERATIGCNKYWFSMLFVAYIPEQTAHPAHPPIPSAPSHSFISHSNSILLFFLHPPPSYPSNLIGLPPALSFEPIPRIPEDQRWMVRVATPDTQPPAAVPAHLTARGGMGWMVLLALDVRGSETDFRPVGGSTEA